jgi:hypothetical protein
MSDLPRSPSSRTCIYCGAPATSKEHAIPKWIPRYFGLQREVMEHTRARGIPRIASVRFDDYAGRFYCRDCHTRVNRTIENPAIPVLKRLFPLGAGTLQPEEQQLLAAWGAKTAYAVWGRMQKRRGVAVAHRRQLIKSGSPHRHVYVSYSRCTGDRIRVIFARTEIKSAQDGATTWVYDCVLALGNVAIKVWGPAEPARNTKYKTPTSLAARVWPPDVEIGRWPPGRVLDDDGVTELWDFDPRALKSSKDVQ